MDTIFVDRLFVESEKEKNIFSFILASYSMEWNVQLHTISRQSLYFLFILLFISEVKKLKLIFYFHSAVYKLLYMILLLP